jgi:YVTN family beta-propeller protein
VLGCGASPRLGAVSSSIVLLPSGDVAVVDPDQGSVSVLDPATLDVRRSIAVGDEPRALLVTRAGVLLGTVRRTGEVVRLDPERGAVIDRARICDGPFGLAESPDGVFVAVACEWDGTLRRLDPRSLATTVVASGLSRPRAVAVVGGDVLVAGMTGGEVERLPASGAATRRSLVPTESAYRPALTTMTANLAEALLPAGDALYVAHELVNHGGDVGTEKVADDYGSVLDGNPKINPAVTALALTSSDLAPLADRPVTYAAFDGGPRGFNGPAALAAFDRYLLVVHRSSNNVAVIDPFAATSEARVVGSYKVGPGPAGIAVDAGHRVAFVDNAFDGSVSRLELNQGFSAAAPAFAAALTKVRALPRVYSQIALEGRKLFYDATNPHVTPSGVVACATCHPGGGDDGLVWFMHTDRIPLKRRRSPDLANAHTGTAPFHWDGQFATMADLARATMTDLMAGDGLLVDVDSVAAFLDEIVRAPALTPADPAAVSRGQALYESAAVGCATCHPGPLFTDGQLHAVLSPVSLSTDDLITQVNTPGLRGVFLRAPYFHDGRSPDLRDLLTRPDAAGHGSTGQLSSAQLDDLIAYLKSL